jgi:hypothetical protein
VSGAGLVHGRGRPSERPGPSGPGTGHARRSKYSRSVRHTSGRLKHLIYAEYGINRATGHYEIDHLIPLGVGGADTRENLWPESRDTQPWNAGVKDRLENYLHVEVCAGRLGVLDAQKAIAADWIVAYRRFLGEP